MGMSLPRLARLLGKSVDHLNTDDVLRAYGPELLYAPRPQLAPAVRALLANLHKRKRSAEDLATGGEQLEAVAAAAFMGICPRAALDSYRSPTAEIDLLGAGTSDRWEAAFKGYLGLPSSTVVVECKATKKGVDDAIFSRMCALLSVNFKKGSLGIFFATAGATGFPDRLRVRQNKLGESRLRQALFYAASEKPIIVLTTADLRRLAKGENLLSLLKAKILDVEALAGTPEADPGKLRKDAHLPAHIQAIVQACRASWVAGGGTVTKRRRRATARMPAKKRGRKRARK